MKSKKGFTLIELLVVISIISLLSSIVIASLSTARERARIAGAKVFASRAFQALGADAGIILNFELTTSPFTTEESGDNNAISVPLGSTPSSSSDTPSGLGRSIDFDGSVDFINISGSKPALADATDSGKNFTFATWFKPTGNLVAPTTAGYILFRQGYHEGIFQSGNKFCGIIWSNSNPSSNLYICNPATYTIGKWYHVAFSVSSTDSKIILYVDGQRVAEATIPGSFILRDYANSNFVAGGVLNYLSRGIMDEARFYTDAINR